MRLPLALSAKTSRLVGATGRRLDAPSCGLVGWGCLGGGGWQKGDSADDPTYTTNALIGKAFRGSDGKV